MSKEELIAEMSREVRAFREARESKTAAEVQALLGTFEKSFTEKLDKLAEGLPHDPEKVKADEKWMKFLDGIAEQQVRAAWKAEGERGRLNGKMIDGTGWTFEQRQALQTKELERYYDPTTVARIRLMQDLSDEALLVGNIRHWSAKRAGLTNEPQPTNFIKQTKAYKQLMQLRAMDTLTATEGLEWIPTEFSGQLYDVVTVSLKVAANFPTLTMPAPVFKIPVATTDDIAFLIPENVTDAFLNDANKKPTITPGTGNITLTSKTLGCLTVFSEEVSEDSIIAIVPFLRQKLGNAVSNAIERAVLDGDTAATHMDADVTVATDARKAWNGLRKDAIASSTTYDVQSTAAGGEAALSANDFLKLRSLLTEAYSEDPTQLAFVTSVATTIKMMAFPEFVTVDKAGANATIVRGQVGMIWGTPVLTSKYVRMDVAATGVRTGPGPNTFGVIYLVNRNGWLLGNRRGVVIKTMEAIWSDQALMTVTWRGDFQKLRVGQKVTAVGINVPV